MRAELKKPERNLCAEQKKRSSVTHAFKKTAEVTGYSERQIWTLTEDLRGA
jgi:hypothetical protein